MIYLCRGHERAVCEDEKLAARREAQGYQRCTAEAHRVLWTIANIEDQTRIVGEDCRGGHTRGGSPVASQEGLRAILG